VSCSFSREVDADLVVAVAIVVVVVVVVVIVVVVGGILRPAVGTGADPDAAGGRNLEKRVPAK
jgi:hypothetical protein